MDNKTIEQLLSSLVALVGDARGSLFGQDKCMVDQGTVALLGKRSLPEATSGRD